MHHIYHTEGIILGSRDYGETGRYYHIFTKDLGMLYASAQGVRKMSSKLRFVLRDFSHVKVDLVQGKDFWRITSASKTDHLEAILRNRPALAIFANLAGLLKRLLAGAERNEGLFSDLLKGLTILEKTEKTEDLQNLEIVLVLRILHNLGYIGGEKNLDKLTRSPFESELLLEIVKSKKEALRRINQALRETHL